MSLLVQKQIMIVEDEWLIADDLQNNLESFGYSVSDKVSSGKEAMKSIKSKKPDLIIMDIKLKGEMDGIDTAIQIKTLFNIPIIFLTAYSSEKLLSRIKVVGPYGYLIKPFRSNELHNTIEISLFKHAEEMKTEKKKRKSLTIKKNGLKHLDKIDQLIIKKLNQNGRAKLVDISKYISSMSNQYFSDVSVRKRLSKLVENESIKIQGNLNLNKFGFITAILQMETENNDITQEIILKYKNCPKILFSFCTSGKFNLVFVVMGETIHSLENYINECSPKVHPGILDSKLNISSEIEHPQFLPIVDYSSNKENNCLAGFNCKECDFFSC